MYVVGANLLSDFWTDHPACEGQLRALHALFANSDAASLQEILGDGGELDGRRVVELPSVRVSVALNEAASIAKITSVELNERT